MLPLLVDHHRRAAAQLPAQVLDYGEGGSGDETTLAEAEQAWRAVRLRPRVLRDVAAVDTSLNLLGTPLQTPVGAAPSALHGLLHDTAERGTAQGARAAGALTVLSSRASVPAAEVGADPWWLQVYVLRDRGFTRDAVQAAAAAGARALVLTGDTPYVAKKLRGPGPAQVTQPPSRQQDPSIGLDVIGWLAEASGLPVLVKGVLRADDARACAGAGAAGLVVSNHGGRQLDRALPTADALPEVTDAVDIPVLVDGGIRSGLDVLCALALGARAVLLGRPVMWALAADGAAGVEACLRAVTEDLSRSMALAGAAHLGEVTRDLAVGRPAR
ncbi:MAG TPA: alpha-hydroxy-acid oxidizing protein [Mycobacteriales bacterium]|jgi:4-hydroxymandelate oxidase|nr:alpha-hydroxy-acid oxidizing protein [Mycobacteriales bacterium]